MFEARVVSCAASRLEWTVDPEDRDDGVCKVQEKMGEVRTVLFATAVTGRPRDERLSPIRSLLDHHTSNIRVVDPSSPWPLLSSPDQRFCPINSNAARNPPLMALHNLPSYA